MKLFILILITLLVSACGKSGSDNGSTARRDRLNSSCHIKVQSHDPEELILKGYHANRECGLSEEELKQLI